MAPVRAGHRASRSVYILNDKEAYGLGVATQRRRTRSSVLDIDVDGFAAWDPKASSYEALMNKVKATGADAVFLGGLVTENGAPGDQGQGAPCSARTTATSKLLAPDGFTPFDEVDEGRQVERATGMFITVAGAAARQADRGGRDLHQGRSRPSSDRGRSSRTRRTPRRRPQVLLDAIATAAAARGRHRRRCSRPDVRTASSAASRSTRTATRTSGAVTVVRARCRDCRRADEGDHADAGRWSTRRAGRVTEAGQAARGGLRALPGLLLDRGTSHRDRSRQPTGAGGPAPRGRGDRTSTTVHRLGLVARRGCWLIVNLVKAPELFGRRLRHRAHERRRLRAGRSRLHARLRHPRS